MRKYFGAAAILVFGLAITLAVWGGGRDIFESPVSSIPSILIDHHEDETEIYVHGMNDFRYTNMSLLVTVGNTTYERTRADALFIYYNISDNISEKRFTINITIWNKNKEYNFNGTIMVADPLEAPTLLTIYEAKKDKVNTITLTAGNLPWKKFMERVK